MKLKKLLLGIIIASLSAQTFSGVRGLTIHSRANCANNESISWELGRSRWLLTVSDHLHNGKKQHSLISGWENTWRSANVHWGEAAPKSGWFVQAGHYQKINGHDYLIGYTIANDCNIYDGWWDH